MSIADYCNENEILTNYKQNHQISGQHLPPCLFDLISVHKSTEYFVFIRQSIHVIEFWHLNITQHGDVSKCLYASALDFIYCQCKPMGAFLNRMNCNAKQVSYKCDHNETFFRSFRFFNFKHLPFSDSLWLWKSIGSDVFSWDNRNN